MKFSTFMLIASALSLTVNAAPLGGSLNALEKRRFGQEHTPQADATFQAVKDLAQGTDKEAQAGNLSGAMVRALLAKAPACDQQDRADEVVDLARELGGDKEPQMIKVAQMYRQLERNTPKDGQPSELCDKQPRNKELDGLTQAQDPTGNDGNDGNNDAATTTNPNMSTATTPPDSENDGNDGNDGDNVPTTSGTTNMANPTNSPKDNNKGKKKGKDNKDDGEGKKDPKDSGSIPTDTSENDSTDPNVNPAEANPLGGVKMPKIQKSDDGAFIVNGNRFVTEDAAHGRQCDIQHNLCANKSNGGDKSFSVGDCDQQNNECRDGPPVFE
ncbi:hypothetical protein C2G38_278075 [Gigaspora rosea]|uniref:Uncharacterized protein n=1 Tax=Gigaspora rosea TaxID=44941 RepID=A0A397UJB3_9GLOM|nr:hypothetical protein C2G38_278075 [Gigaspora rosea]